MNFEWLLEYNPVLLALGATLFTWGAVQIKLLPVTKLSMLNGNEYL